MEKSRVISLLAAAIADPKDFDSLVKVSEASKLVSNSLLGPSQNSLASDCEILKLLIYSIPINVDNTLFLLETVFTKFQKYQNLLENVWRIMEFIANIQDDQVVLSLDKKFLELQSDHCKKVIKTTKLEEEYILGNIVELKSHILRLLPQLFKLSYNNSPEAIRDKVYLLKILKANSKDLKLLDTANRLHQQVVAKYCPQLDDSNPSSMITKTKKNQSRRVLNPGRVVADKFILEELVASGSQDIYSLLTSQTRLQTLLNYIISPKAIPADRKIWQKLLLEQTKSVEEIRRETSLKLFSNKESLSKILAQTPDMLATFFNLVQRPFKQINLTMVISLLNYLSQVKPIPVATFMMQTGFLQKVFYSIEQSTAYNFVYAFTTLNHPSVRRHQGVLFDYFKLSEFFQLILANMTERKTKYLQPLKARQFSDFEVRLETNEVQLQLGESKQPVVDLDLAGLPIQSTLYNYNSPSNKSSIQMYLNPNLAQTLSSIASSANIKKGGSRLSKIKQVPSTKPKLLSKLPPFAVKEYRGYYSTCPIIKFSTVETNSTCSTDMGNQNWMYINCRLYFEIISALINQKDRLSSVGDFLPSSQQLGQMFQALKKYRAISPNSADSNSSIEISKLLLLFLQNPLISKHYEELPRFCEKYIHTIYPIVNSLFLKDKAQTRIQKLHIVKTLGIRAIEILQLFLQMIKTLKTEDKQRVLDQLDDNIWQMLTLWFMDCMLNNVYQTVVYQLFVQLFAYGSEILLLNILFKNNLVGTLYNAFSDVMKNGVLITEWHIHSFFLYVCKFYYLIKSTVWRREQFQQIPAGLSKMVSWNLLEAKIKETGMFHLENCEIIKREENVR